MKLTIESTPELYDHQGTPLRRWRGTTERGESCDVYVAVIRVCTGADQDCDVAASRKEIEEVMPRLQLTPVAGQDQAAEMEQARDFLLTSALRHEREDHNGAPCMEGRIRQAAYLAHALGIRSERHDHAMRLLTALEDVERHCRETTCDHDGGGE